MPQFDEIPTLEVAFFEDLSVFPYSDLTLVSSMPDSGQIQVIWNVNTVYTGPNQSGSAVAVEGLEDFQQAAIRSLDSDQYTLNVTDKTVSLVTAEILDQPVVVGTSTYYYPSTLTISTAQTLVIRRSTDVTTRTVDFQPGSRLTADVLNAANSQVFNAIQELTEFGTGGGGGGTGDVDLSLYSVTDLGDVDFSAGNGLVSWNGNDLVSGSSAGTLVPDYSGAADGMALLKNVPSINGEPVSWRYMTFSDIYATDSGSIDLNTTLAGISSDLTTLNFKTGGFGRVDTTTTFTDDLVATDLTVNDTKITMSNGEIMPLDWNVLQVAKFSQPNGQQVTDSSNYRNTASVCTFTPKSADSILIFMGALYGKCEVRSTQGVQFYAYASDGATSRTQYEMPKAATVGWQARVVEGNSTGIGNSTNGTFVSFNDSGNAWTNRSSGAEDDTDRVVYLPLPVNGFINSGSTNEREYTVVMRVDTTATDSVELVNPSSLFIYEVDGTIQLES